MMQEKFRLNIKKIRDFRPKSLDRFQVAGFTVSIVISVGLIVRGQDTIASVSLGLILATLTQLFDLQIRQSASEKRLLQTNLLNRELYYDEWLLENIQSIVDDYISSKSIWLDFFKRQADNAIIDCRNALHTMVDQGYVYANFPSPLLFGLTAFREAKETIKIVVVVHSSFWQGDTEEYLQVNKDAINLGVSVTRIFLETRDVLRSMLNILEEQQRIGVNVRIGFTDDNEIPEELIEDCLIMDDRAVTQLDLTRDGKPKQERLSIVPVVVQRKLDHFDMLFHFTHELNDIIDTLKQK